MRILLISTYESGHQPLHVASPAAALVAHGHDVSCLDLSIDPWDPALAVSVDAVAISVPMHTAMRLGLRVAQLVRRLRPGLPICLYGLYAPVSRDTTVPRLVDRVIAGEYEPGLLAWAGAVASGGWSGPSGPVVQLGRGRGHFEVPARHLLPPLERYAHLSIDGEERLVGAVETTHGCAHECRHCPLPTVYDGRFRVVPEDVVLDDIGQLVAAGARHITFADPDFLNGPRHSRRIVGAMRERFPGLTYDCTVKVEHILEHEQLWPELAAAGCLFVVSAVECLDERILELLEKRHTREQVSAAVGLLRRHGIEMRPSFLPFTPWTTPRDLRDILDFVVEHDLIGNVDPVQYTIRLLLPEGSLLLERPELAPHLDGYDSDALSYRWRPADPRMDDLQQRLAAVVETGGHRPAGAVFLDILSAVNEVAGDGPPAEAIPAGATEGRPRLTEPWFC